MKRKKREALHQVAKKPRNQGYMKPRPGSSFTSSVPQVKLLQLVSEMNQRGLLDDEEKTRLRALIFAQDEKLVWVVRAFEDNEEELLESLRELL